MATPIRRFAGVSRSTAIALGGLHVYAGTAAATGQVLLSAFSTNDAILTVGSDSSRLVYNKTLVLGNNMLFNGHQISDIIAGYNGIATVGLGVPAIYGGGTTQHKTNAAPTAVTYTPPSAAGSYVLNVAATIKTATSLALKLKLTYTGADGSAKTDTPGWLISTGGQTNGGTGLTTAINGAISYMFNVDASGGVITLADNSGTYTTCEYYLTPTIQQFV